MKSINIILILCVCVFSTLELMACDGCGGNIGSNSGLLNVRNQSYISFMYDQVSYTSTPTSGHNTGDKFWGTRLNARYAIGQKISIEGSLPYFSKNRYTESNSTLAGFGDVSVGINYAIPTQWISIADVYSEFGGFAKLPTGSYNSDLHDIDLPQNFNIGGGSMAYGAKWSVAVKQRSYGVIASSIFTYLSSTQDGFKFGNTFASNLVIYKKINLGIESNLLLNSGLQYDYQAKDQYQNGNVVSASGSSSVSIPFNVGFAYKDWMIQAELAMPIYQNIINSELESSPNLRIQFTYFLKN